jgi:hypothetical protein
MDSENSGIALPSGRFSGREAFQQLVRDALACAAREGWRELIVSDASFEDWPLKERSVVESLQAWSQRGRHFVMLASRYDAVQRDQPRFVRWRQTWSHIIDCRVCGSAEILDLPSAIWSPNWVMRRTDPQRCIGISGSEPDRRLLLRELLDEYVRNSSAGFASSVLGL